MPRIQRTLFSALSALLALLAGNVCRGAETPSDHTTCLHTLAYTASVPLVQTNYNTTISVPRFDPAHGNLISVQFKMNGIIQSRLKVESLDKLATTISITRFGKIALRRSDSSELVAAAPPLSCSFNASPYDGVSDFGGTSGKDYGVVPTSQSSSSSALTSVSDLTLFTGLTPISLPVAASASYLITSTGNRLSQTTTQASATIEVIYTYRACNIISGTVTQESPLVDGIAQAGEPGVSGVAITLTGDTDGDGDTETITTTTDASGNYRFEHLFPGSFEIAEQLPAGYSISPNTPTLHNVAATTPNQTYRPYDFFLYIPVGSIGDIVWYDIDNDGAQDAGEPGIAGVTVTLQDSLGDPLASTTTDATGHYLFEHLVGNDYRVCVDANTLPAGLTHPTFDRDGGDDSKTAIVLGLNQTLLEGDFGFTGTGSIGDLVWNDSDGNGVAGSAETGINGVTVSLIGAGPDGQLDTSDDITYANQLTGGNGNYRFFNLPAGLFRVKVEACALLTGYVSTFDADGTGTPDRSERTLSAGESRTEEDFGYRQAAIEQGITRASGYWKTHVNAMQAAVNNHSIDLGILIGGGGANQTQNLTNPTIGDVMAIFWANDTKQGRDQRSALGKARMKLANHLMAAMANACLLGTTTAQNGFSPTLIQDARAALDGNDTSLMNTLMDQLDAFNNSGDAIACTAAQAQISGPAGPNGAKAAAKKDGTGEINPGPAFR